MPKISVIMPVYKAEKYIHKAVDSILMQTFTDFELILVDDGSPDTCPKICDEYAKADTRIRCFHKENEGISATRNFGVQMALAEWVAFVDADDIIHPRYLEVLYRGVATTQAKMSVSAIATFSDENQIEFAENDIETCEVKLNEAFLCEYWMKENTQAFFKYAPRLVHKEIAKEFPMPAGKIHEDVYVASIWSDMAKVISYTEAPLYYYRVTNQDSVTAFSGYSTKRLDLLDALEVNIDYWNNKRWMQVVAMQRKEYIRTLVANYLMIDDTIPNAKSIRKTLKRKIKNTYLFHSKDLEITKSEKKQILAILYPTTTRVFSKIRSCFGKNRRSK